MERSFVGLKKFLKKFKKSTCIIFKSVVLYTSTADTVSNKRKLRLIGQAVKTPPSHGGNRGSIPLSAAKNFEIHKGFKVFFFLYYRKACSAEADLPVFLPLRDIPGILMFFQIPPVL